MEQNYTPLDVNKYNNGNDNKFNSVLLFVAVITALVLAVLLYVLINKKSQNSNVIPTSLPSPTVTIPTIVASPTPVTSPTVTLSPTATSSSSSQITPVATSSPTVTP